MTQTVQELNTPRFKTVKTLAEVPGAYERGSQEILRALSARYGVRFRAVDDEREPVSRPCVAAAADGTVHDSTRGRHAA